MFLSLLLPVACRCARYRFSRGKISPLVAPLKLLKCEALSTMSQSMDPNRIVWVDLEVCELFQPVLGISHRPAPCYYEIQWCRVASSGLNITKGCIFCFR